MKSKKIKIIRVKKRPDHNGMVELIGIGGMHFIMNVWELEKSGYTLEYVDQL